MSNVNIPQKSPGDLRTSAEENQITNWNNSPMTNLGAFNVAVDFSTQGYYSPHSLSGNETWDFSNLVAGIGQYVKVTASGGETITIGTNGSLINGSLDSLDAGIYVVYLFCPDGQEVHVSAPGTASTPSVIPQWQTGSFEVGIIANNQVVLPVDVALDPGSIPAVTDFDIQVDAGSNIVTLVDLSTANQVRLTLTTPVTSGQSVTAAYTAGINPIQSAATGDPAASFTATLVTNNVSGFLPSDLNGILVWFAGDLSVSEAGTGINIWGDQINGYDIVQGTDANRPTYNNPEVLFIQANGDALQNTANASSLAGSSGYMWAVIKKTGDTDTMSGFSVNTSTSNQLTLDLASSGAGTAPDKARLLINPGGAGFKGVSSTTNITNDTYYLVYAESNSSAWTLYLNGVEETNTVTTNDGSWFDALTPPDKFQVGGVDNSISNGGCKSSGYGVGSLTPTERNNLFSYLNSKYTIY